MGIVLAVKKKGYICIASDSMTVVGGSRKQTADDIVNAEKIIKWGSSYIGIASHPVWPLVLTNYIEHTKHKPNLGSKEQIFEELLKLHQALKDKYYLNPHDEEDDSFESSRFESLIINPHGIFKTYDLRSVEQFIHYAAIGSGAPYALGALHALYDRLDSAEDIAREVLKVVVEFDDSSGFPETVHMVKSK